jgi:hypothetical protein
MKMTHTKITAAAQTKPYETTELKDVKKINRRKNNILHVVGQVPSTIFSTLLKSQNIELKHTRMTVLLHRFEPEEIS